MISIARHTDYAARLVLHIAALGDDAQVKLDDVAEERRMPIAFIRRLVGRLTKAKLLVARRGAGGGIRLARPAAEISLLDIVEAMEGGVVLNRCVHGGEGCPLKSRCPISCVWNVVNRQLKESLASARFDVLARTPEHTLAHLQLSSASSFRPTRSATAVLTA